MSLALNDLIVEGINFAEPAEGQRPATLDDLIQVLESMGAKQVMPDGFRILVDEPGVVHLILPLKEES